MTVHIQFTTPAIYKKNLGLLIATREQIEAVAQM